jgi:hypothetical protein
MRRAAAPYVVGAVIVTTLQFLPTGSTQAAFSDSIVEAGNSVRAGTLSGPSEAMLAQCPDSSGAVVQAPDTASAPFDVTVGAGEIAYIPVGGGTVHAAGPSCVIVVADGVHLIGLTPQVTVVFGAGRAANSSCSLAAEKQRTTAATSPVDFPCDELAGRLREASASVPAKQELRPRQGLPSRQVAAQPTESVAPSTGVVEAPSVSSESSAPPPRDAVPPETVTIDSPDNDLGETSPPGSTEASPPSTQSAPPETTSEGAQPTEASSPDQAPGPSDLAPSE